MRIVSWTRSRKALAATVGVLLAGGGAFAATNWVVGVNSGSSAQGESAGISNLTITAVASPSATNLLYPGGNGDVVLTISNPNPYPVTITGVQLPTNTTYATGYSDSGRTTANTGCTSSTSDVIWNYSTASTGSSHTFTTPLTVAAASGTNGTLTVTLTNDASMTTSAPAACANTYFAMPSFTGIAASGGAGTATTSPATDAWTA